MRADLHTHSNISDGALKPKDLIIKAKTNNIDIMSITDHDSIEYDNKLIDYAKDIGVKLIAGIELSTTHKDGDVHLLGYFRDDSYKNTEFQKKLTYLKEQRIFRGEQIVQNLKKYFNINIDFDKLLHDSRSIIARPHIAKAIISAGYDYTFSELFETVLSKNSLAYIPNYKFPLTNGIKMLKDLNAVTVIAHPTLLRSNKIEDLMDLGFDGLECVYSQNKIGEYEKFKNLCIKYNKLCTGGSDYHGLIGDIKHAEIGTSYIRGEILDRFLSYYNS